MGFPPLANCLQILNNINKQVPVLFAFGPICDGMTEISALAIMYRKMDVVTVKR
jgi:hypothetical protein